MKVFNELGLQASRCAEVECYDRSESIKWGDPESRLSHLVCVGGGLAYHTGKLTARVFSLANRVLGVSVGGAGVVLTFGQSRKVNQFTLKQGALLGSTVTRIFITPFQLVSFATGSVLGFVTPRGGIKLIKLSAEIDCTFDSLDVAIQGGNAYALIRKAEGSSDCDINERPIKLGRRINELVRSE